jgi:hypothetical protein
LEIEKKLLAAISPEATKTHQEIWSRGEQNLGNFFLSKSITLQAKLRTGTPPLAK